MDFHSRNDQFIAKASRNAIPIGSTILNYPPSCIEFVPPTASIDHLSEYHLFVVGTYDLQKEVNEVIEEQEEDVRGTKEQSRQGSLTLFKLQNENLTELQTIHTPSAILDLHFFPNRSIFAVASSTATISFFEIRQREGNNHEIVSIASHQVLEPDMIITYFAWDERSPPEAPRMAITSTTGAVMTLTFSEDYTKFEFENDSEPYGQHDFEAWCCAFSGDSRSLYSGGDDSKLILSSLDVEAPLSRKLPFHNAGVTMILPIPTPESSAEDPEILLTGSYDDFIRVYQPPSLYSTKSKVLASKDIGCSGGGVWRLKFLTDPNDPPKSDQSDLKRRFLVLASCMRVGCKVLEIKESREGEWTIDVLAKTAVHESMNYASDVVPLSIEEVDKGKDMRTIVSTSFYDRLLFVWRYDPAIELEETLE